MHSSISRRSFLKRSALAGAGLLVIDRAAWARNSPNERLNVAFVGVGGRGEASLNAVSQTENVVALCDIDDTILRKAAARFPKAATYHDFRRMLDERKDIDAVVVSTPDHTHAPAAMAALQLDKHVYCEKPLTHSVYEARRLAEEAARRKVATQMGNQGHSNSGARRTVELVESGAIGPVREVHCWTDRPIWPQGIDRPIEVPLTPETIHWDLWIGPAPKRPYHPAYHPFKWRGWWDFGTGALGDMACHVMDAAFWALKLGAPTSVEAEGEPHHPESAPKWSIIRYEFPARHGLPPVRLTWYDGGKLPPAELFEGEKIIDNGTLMIGEAGKLYLPDPYGAAYKLLPAAKFEGFQPPKPYIPNVSGHHADWIEAAKTGRKAGSHFEYAGALTEMVLLGNVAFRAGQKIYWDPANLRATNCPEAERFIRREYRRGWSL